MQEAAAGTADPMQVLLQQNQALMQAMQQQQQAATLAAVGTVRCCQRCQDRDRSEVSGHEGVQQDEAIQAGGR